MKKIDEELDQKIIGVVEKLINKFIDITDEADLSNFEMTEVYETYIVSLACKMHSAAEDDYTKKGHPKLCFAIAEFLKKKRRWLAFVRNVKNNKK